MTQIAETLTRLHRPRLLIQAARHGAETLVKGRGRASMLVGQSVQKLLHEEDELNAERENGDAGYSVRRHVTVLIALLCAAERPAPRYV